MGNRWSATRRILRRPPVCRSKSPEDTIQAWPSLHIAPEWNIFSDPMNPTHYTQGTMATIQFGTSNEYSAAFLSDEGEACLATIFLGYAPGQTAVHIEILVGPNAGVTMIGLCPGWNGLGTWDSIGNALTPNVTPGTASIDLHVP